MHTNVKSIIDSYGAADTYLSRSRRTKPLKFDKTVVECWEISSDSDNEPDLMMPCNPNVIEYNLKSDLKIKEERIEMLQVTIKKLNERLGTEVIDDNESSAQLPFKRQHSNGLNVNTLHYQRDEEFGKPYFFITNVRQCDILGLSKE